MAHVTEVDQATFQKLLQSDPDVQAVIQRVWGTTPANQRPSDTPKNLEQANDQASKQIAQILKSKGVQMPAHTFVNPRTGSLEAEHGWAGLPTAAKIAIIAGVAATGVGAAGALGAFGGAAAGAGAGGGASAAGGAAGAAGAGAAGAAGAAIPTIAATTGLSALPGVALGGGLTLGAGAGGAAAAGLGAAGTVAGGGSMAGGLTTAATSALKNPKTYMDILGSVGQVAGQQAKGEAEGKNLQATLNQGQDRNALSLYATQQAAENQAAQTDLERQQFGNTNRSTTAKQALIGALLGGGVSPTSLSGGKASGGLLQAMNKNPGALEAMKALASQGATAQNTPLSFTGGAMVKPPTLSSVPQVDQGGMLATLGKFGQLAGAASPFLKQLQQQNGGG